jgi:hypothetical protein
LLLGIAGFCASSEGDETESDRPASNWEERAVRALLSEDRQELNDLAKEFQQAPLEVRRDLPVRIRTGAIEIRLQGEIPIAEGRNRPFPRCCR